MSELKEKIIRISIKEFMANGYDNVTVDTICSKSGIAKNTFYYHFKSKDEVLAYYYKEKIKISVNTTIELMKLSSCYDKLWYLYTLIFNVSQDMGAGIYKNMIAWGMKNGHVFMSAFLDDEQQNDSMRLILEIINHGQQSGELRNNYSAEILMWSFNNAMLGSRIHWCSQNGSIDETSQLKQLFDLIFLP